MKLFLICSSNSRRGLKFSVGVWRDHIPTPRKTALDFAVLTTPNALHTHLTQQSFQPVHCSHQSQINQKIAARLIRSGRRVKKDHPFFNAVPNQKKDGQQERAGAIRTAGERAKRQPSPEQ